MEEERPYDQVTELLPQRLKAQARALPAPWQEEGEELRLRLGFPMTLLLPWGEEEVGEESVRAEDLRCVVEQASQASAHTVVDKVRRGFVTLRGGHRIGLCGTAVTREGEIVTLRELSSLSLRIARPVVGQAGPLLPQLMTGDKLESTLILAPPGAGKTTLLRDLVRAISDGETGTPLRVGVADERGEIAALWRGCPQLYVGRHTDVLDGCSKAEGVSLLLRGMNPQVIAVDEITQPQDVVAMGQGAGCGVTLLATAHGAGLEDLYRRPVYRQLGEIGVFRRIILLSREEGVRRARVEVLT